MLRYVFVYIQQTLGKKTQKPAYLFIAGFKK